MSRANRPHITAGADAALVAACQAFIAAAAELNAFSRTGQGDGAAVTKRYCAALAGLTEALPGSPGAFTARALAAHLATRTMRRALPHDARAQITAVMAKAS